MIYTITLNPAVDYVMRTNTVKFGSTNRSTAEEIHFGGKGINVSLVLKEFAVPSTALGFIGGFTGDALECHLKNSGIQTDFIRLSSGVTRINLKLKTDVETEINANGPNISESEFDALLAKLNTLTGGDTIVLAGSIPASLPENTYERICERVCGKGVRIIIDAEKELLTNTLKFKPFLIKPNLNELCEIFKEQLETDEQIANAAGELHSRGAENVLVSLGKRGALLCDSDGNITSIGSVGGKPINTVGAGDSMVAGFLAGYINSGSYEYALKSASAAGGASACSQSLAKKQTIDEFLNML